jgi:hypothetical protein
LLGNAVGQEICIRNFFLELENVYDGKRSLEIAGKLNIK